MKSVLQDWVMELPLRAQGTLLTGVRGCDLTPKPPVGEPDSAERQLVAFLRWCILNPADEREVGIPGAFFQPNPPDQDLWKPSQFGHYPQHWYSHVMHCFEVIGYCHPSLIISSVANGIYLRMVHNMHLTPETKEQMMDRLTEDRIANDTVVS